MKITIIITLAILCTHCIDEYFYRKDVQALQIQLKQTQIEAIRWQLRYKYGKYLHSDYKLFNKRKNELKKNKKLMEFIKFSKKNRI